MHRRDLLGLASLPLLASAPQGDPGRPGRKVVVTGGHPGDPEYGCGGTIARLSDRGDAVVLLYLNDGVPTGKPKDGVRVAEAREACEILKARAAFAGQVDGDSVVDRTHAEAFAGLLEAERPDAVFTHWPIDDHADHRAMAMLVLGAWLKLGRRFALYFYEVSNGEDTAQFTPTHLVDVTAAEPTKRRACFAHASQSPGRYYDLQRQVARFRGLELGVAQAEGFARHPRGPGFDLPS